MVTELGVTPAVPAPTAGNRQKREISELDGVRGLAIALVLWYHTGIVDGRIRPPSLIKPVSDLSFWGVYLFFVLSGFLLFLPYARALTAETAWPSVRRFYIRRARRILPLYYLVLFCAVSGFIILSGSSGVDSTQLISFVAVVFLLHDMLRGAWSLMMAIDSPLWSLAAEWQFYLLLPWITIAFGWIAHGRRSWCACRRIALGLALLAGFGLCVRAAAAYAHYAGGLADPISAPGISGFAFALFFGMKGKFLELFALGMAVSLLYVVGVEQGRLSAAWFRRIGRVSLLAAPCGLLSCLVWGFLDGRLSFTAAYDTGIWPVATSWAWAVFGAFALGACACLVLALALIGPEPVRRVFRWGPLRFLGIISYSLYVWHYPILFAVSNVLEAQGVASYPRLLVMASVIALIVGSFSYWLVERPLLHPGSGVLPSKWKSRISTRKR